MPMINFLEAARRHYSDARLLHTHNRQANSGQLYGFSAECGIKALLVAHGLPTETNGDIQRKPATGFRDHLPGLRAAIHNLNLFHDGRDATRYLSLAPNIHLLDDWKVDHRYFSENQLPNSLSRWQQAAAEVMKMIDQAVSNGEFK